MSEEYDEQDPIPYSFLSSLEDGRQMLKQLEDELVYLVNDFLRLSDQMSEVTAATIQFTIAKTEEAIEQIELEMKMFND